MVTYPLRECSASVPNKARIAAAAKIAKARTSQVHQADCQYGISTDFGSAAAKILRLALVFLGTELQMTQEILVFLIAGIHVHGASGVIQGIDAVSRGGLHHGH